jgi:hypothetical protein
MALLAAGLRTTRQRKQKFLELLRTRCAAWRDPVQSTTTAHPPPSARWGMGLRTCRTGCHTNNDTVPCVTWRLSNVRGNFTATSGSRHFSPSTQPRSVGGFEWTLWSQVWVLHYRWSSCSPPKYFHFGSSVMANFSCEKRITWLTDGGNLFSWLRNPENVSKGKMLREFLYFYLHLHVNIGKVHKQFYSKNQKGRDSLKYLSCYERLILKRVLRK